MADNHLWNAVQFMKGHYYRFPGSTMYSGINAKLLREFNYRRQIKPENW